MPNSSQTSPFGQNHVRLARKVWQKHIKISKAEYVYTKQIVGQFLLLICGVFSELMGEAFMDDTEGFIEKVEVCGSVFTHYGLVSSANIIDNH